MGGRRAGLRLKKGEPGVAFSGAAPVRLQSTNALAYPIKAAGVELLKETLALLMPRLWPELPGAGLCHVIHNEILLEAPKALAQAAADQLIEMKQDPRLQTRYLREVLPLVGEVHVGTSWTETHLGHLTPRIRRRCASVSSSPPGVESRGSVLKAPWCSPRRRRYFRSFRSGRPTETNSANGPRKRPPQNQAAPSWPFESPTALV